MITIIVIVIVTVIVIVMVTAIAIVFNRVIVSSLISDHEGNLYKQSNETSQYSKCRYCSNCYWQGMYALKLLNYCIICIHIKSVMSGGTINSLTPSLYPME